MKRNVFLRREEKGLPEERGEPNVQERERDRTIGRVGKDKEEKKHERRRVCRARDGTRVSQVRNYSSIIESSTLAPQVHRTCYLLSDGGHFATSRLNLLTLAALANRYVNGITVVVEIGRVC